MRDSGPKCGPGFSPRALRKCQPTRRAAQAFRISSNGGSWEFRARHSHKSQPAEVGLLHACSFRIDLCPNSRRPARSLVPAILLVRALGSSHQLNSEPADAYDLSWPAPKGPQWVLGWPRGTPPAQHGWALGRIVAYPSKCRAGRITGDSERRSGLGNTAWKPSLRPHRRIDRSRLPVDSFVHVARIDPHHFRPTTLPPRGAVRHFYNPRQGSRGTSPLPSTPAPFGGVAFC